MPQVGSFIFKGTPEEFIEIASEIIGYRMPSDPNNIYVDRLLNHPTEQIYFLLYKKRPRNDGDIGYVELIKVFPKRFYSVAYHFSYGNEYAVEIHFRPLLRGDKETSSVGIRLVKGDWEDIKEEVNAFLHLLRTDGRLLELLDTQRAQDDVEIAAPMVEQSRATLDKAMLTDDQPPGGSAKKKKRKLRDKTRYRCTLVRNRVNVGAESFTDAIRAIELDHRSYKDCEEQDVFFSGAEMLIYLNGKTEEAAWDDEVRNANAV